MEKTIRVAVKTVKMGSLLATRRTRNCLFIFCESGGYFRLYPSLFILWVFLLCNGLYPAGHPFVTDLLFVYNRMFHIFDIVLYARVPMENFSFIGRLRVWQSIIMSINFLRLNAQTFWAITIWAIIFCMHAYQLMEVTP
jgi:hypothetical protein